MRLAASTHRPFTIATGAIASLAVGTIPAVGLGHVLHEVMPAVWVRRVAGAVFIATNLVTILRGWAGRRSFVGGTPRPRRPPRTRPDSPPGSLFS